MSDVKRCHAVPARPRCQRGEKRVQLETRQPRRRRWCQSVTAIPSWDYQFENLHDCQPARTAFLRTRSLAHGHSDQAGLRSRKPSVQPASISSKGVGRGEHTADGQAPCVC